jgi:hypothetical protein
VSAFLQNLGPTRLGYINSEGIDPSLPLICWRTEDSRERAFPVIRGLDRSVEITSCFVSFREGCVRQLDR